jgi:S-DNA-T family DNA segregation ATPase FtsK/SpoIIIE
VFTSLIRANVPTRLTFKTSTAIESRVATGKNGAETLNGQGDALLMYNGNTTSLQGCLASIEDIQKIISYYNIKLK